MVSVVREWEHRVTGLFFFNSKRTSAKIKGVSVAQAQVVEDFDRS